MFARDIDIRQMKSYSETKKGRDGNASLLYEMQDQEGNKRTEVYHDEEWETRNSRNLSRLWY